MDDESCESMELMEEMPLNVILREDATAMRPLTTSTVATCICCCEHATAVVYHSMRSVLGRRVANYNNKQVATLMVATARIVAAAQIGPSYSSGGAICTSV